MNDERSIGVVADRQASARWCRAAPPGARPGHAAAPSGRDPVDQAAARALGDDGGRRVVGPVLGRRGHPVRGGHRGAGRRVDLLVVVQLDDLGAVEVRRGQLGEAHHQHRADREVRRDHARWRPTGRTGRRTRASSASLKPVVPTTACTPCSAHHAGSRGAASSDREVDGDLDAGVAERGRLRPTSARWCRGRPSWWRSMPAWNGSTAATSSRSGASMTAAAHGRPHAPTGTEDPDPDHAGKLAKRRSGDPRRVGAASTRSADGRLDRTRRGGQADDASVSSCGPTTASVAARSAKHAVDHTARRRRRSPLRPVRRTRRASGPRPRRARSDPRRRIRLADVSSDIDSEPTRWPFAAASSASGSPPSRRARASSACTRRASRRAARARCRRRSRGSRRRRTRRGTSRRSTRGRALRGPPGTAATTCRRRAPGSPP